MSILDKQTIQIDIDATKNSYSIDFVGVKLKTAYKVLKMIVEGMESGEFFRDNDIELTDANGNTVSGDEARAEILGTKDNTGRTD